MAKGKNFGGFGGGMNMQAMMKQAQKMQENMLKAQEEIAVMETTGTAGGGMVTAVVTGTSTLKKKYDHVVYKRRIGMNYQQAVDYLDGAPAPEESQISREIDWFCRFYEGLQPAMCIFYDRLAVFDREQPDLRVTFDSGIRWRTDDLDLAHGTRGRLLLDPSMCLMEIKIPGAAPVWLARALSDAGVFPSHFSKYGAAYQTMQREEKTIRFNEKGEIYCA